MALRIIQRKNIAINQVLVPDQPFFYDMKLQFQPDEMVVKFVSNRDDPAAPHLGVCTIFCPTINETLASITDGCTIAPNLVFDARNFPNNTRWEFRVLDVSTGIISSTFDTELSIQLEFLKYQ